MHCDFFDSINFKSIILNNLSTCFKQIYESTYTLNSWLAQCSEYLKNLVVHFSTIVKTISDVNHCSCHECKNACEYKNC